MDRTYQQYAQPPQQLQHGYTQQGPSGGSDMTSPHRQNQTQPSPVLASQHQSYPPGPAHPSYSIYQPMGYPPPQAYGLSPMQQQQQQMSASSAAVAAATGGQPYYTQMDQQAMPGADRYKMDNQRPSSSHMQPMQSHNMGSQAGMPQRQMSHSMRSPPPMVPPYPASAQSGPRASQPPASMPPAQHQGPAGHQQGSSQVPETNAPPPAAQTEESPLYVNAKQFHRILKRRVARQKLEDQLRISSKSRKPYLHESRHNHAMRRPRGPGGRFLTAAEVEAQGLEMPEGMEDESPGSGNGDARSGTPNGAGRKRKASRADGANKKKKSVNAQSQSPADDDDGEDGVAPEDDDT